MEEGTNLQFDNSVTYRYIMADFGIDSRYIRILSTDRLPVDQSEADGITLGGLIFALLISLYLNFRHKFTRRGRKKETG